MADTAPWIDPHELDELCERFPGLPRAYVALALEAYWPVKADVESALQRLLQNLEAKGADGLPSLDFTAPVLAAESQR